MRGVIIWALLTGLISGGVWMGIVVSQRRRRIQTGHKEELLEDLHERMGQLEEVSKRLADVEERLDFAERLLSRQGEAPRLPPSS